jgi:hypothetical protein
MKRFLQIVSLVAFVLFADRLSLLGQPLESSTAARDHGGLLPDPRSFSERVHSRNKEGVSILRLCNNLRAVSCSFGGRGFPSTATLPGDFIPARFLRVP